MRRSGAWAEKRALTFLLEKGFQCLEKNFYWKYGEIDLIMKDKNMIVFVEVRSLHHSSDIHPAETISASKIKKIKKTALYYLTLHYKTEHPVRFDVVFITGTPENFMAEHIKDAF